MSTCKQGFCQPTYRIFTPDENMVEDVGDDQRGGYDEGVGESEDQDSRAGSFSPQLQSQDWPEPSSSTVELREPGPVLLVILSPLRSTLPAVTSEYWC